MKRFRTMYLIEQKQFLRSPDVIIFNLTMPAVTLFVIAMIAGNRQAQNGLTMIESSYVALSTVGICCNAFMSIPITIVENRASGILKRMYCSPCSVGWILACDILSCAMMAFLSTLILTILAIICFGYQMKGNIFIYGSVWILTMVSMFSIGMVVASLCKTVKTMNIVTTLIYFPMLLFSGAMIPVELFPERMQFIAKWMPLGTGIQALKKISAGYYQDLMIPVLFLLTIGILCICISIKTFRWE
ncbi:ABC transporter permease [Floccifex sp.]|uniref:ABC transporter permease n=1 Tax=Floccifex sp. TaxID=2815810 RepID=UPI003EFF9327